MRIMQDINNKLSFNRVLLNMENLIVKDEKSIIKPMSLEIKICRCLSSWLKMKIPEIEIHANLKPISVSNYIFVNLPVLFFIFLLFLKLNLLKI